MIRAVVVDDEKLVRKGFISLIDWERFGIVMVGEAADGRSALELLERVEADLVFTDITMPVMSGFELIKQLRQRFPRVKSVVLTCHHEFDFVQEALRLGSIDYIVKTLLEMDNADEVIHRIVERFEWEEGSRATFLTAGKTKHFAASSVLLFIPLVPEKEAGELFQLGVVRRNPLEQLDRMWMVQLVHPPSQEELQRDLGSDIVSSWQVAIVSGLENQSSEDMKLKFVSKLPHLLFYKADQEEPVKVRCEELNAEGIGEKKAEDDRIDYGLDLKWTLQLSEWDVFMQTAREKMPSSDAVLLFAESLCRDWSGLLLQPADASKLLAEKSKIRSWTGWKGWLKRFSDLVQLRMIELSLSKEVMLCLIRAIRFMRANAGEKINQADVAGHVSMSRSYFSQCFAKMAGESFGVVLRNMRLDRAKDLLVQTAFPIYEIASMAGFEDDKYFSKLFREQVGKLPTEFRAKGGESV
ncbi:response regulator transcription factor [Cohnella herbarum]|uniref:Response regulator n=1 Tax=Cohnella herbarum TaxID=2728023 RepID=A0A7Z2VFU9_9BACL|nr:response regulator [Cohnella herbarum]QJD82314.1 response regulator [Cohnella herbarum]